MVDTGTLRPLLKGWGRTPVPVHAVLTSSRYLAPKVQAFVVLARERFTQALPDATV